MSSLLTLRGPFEYDVELLHVIIDQRHFIVAHHELHDIRLYSSLGTAHLATPHQATGLGSEVHRSLGLIVCHSWYLGFCGADSFV